MPLANFSSLILHQSPRFLMQEISLQRQNPSFAGKLVFLEEDDEEGARRSIKGALTLAHRAPMQTTNITGTMRGMSMNPTMKAKEPKSIKVEEMPRRRDASPNAENGGVLRVATVRWC